MAKNLFLILILIIGSKAVRAELPLDDFGSSMIDQTRVSWLRIEEDVKRTNQKLRIELIKWRKLVQSRKLASVDNFEQENFEIWLKLDAQKTEDPTYWLKESIKLRH